VSAIKLLIADVDGTLLTPDKTLTARACTAVQRMHAAGVQFTITSGRPPRGMAMLTEPLRLDHPFAAFNGGMFCQPDLTVIEQCVLPLAVAREVVEYFLHAGFDISVYRGADWFIRRADQPHAAREQSTVRFPPKVVEDLGSVLDGAVKIVGINDDRPLVAQCEADLRRRVGAHASVSRSEPYYIDVTHPNANKGTVVRVASRFLGIPLEEIATIGDMPNDVLMFGIGGTSIAMGNASPEVQRTARHVTTSNTDEGFANAVERFVLGEPRAA
jgi:Cof subfamily protein (haloacid dehalogenase superfamily)